MVACQSECLLSAKPSARSRIQPRSPKCFKVSSISSSPPEVNLVKRTSKLQKINNSRASLHSLLEITAEPGRVKTIEDPRLSSHPTCLTCQLLVTKATAP